MDAATKGAAQLAKQTVVLNNNLFDALQLLKAQQKKSQQVTDKTQAARTQAQAAYDALCGSGDCRLRRPAGCPDRPDPGADRLRAGHPRSGRCHRRGVGRESAGLRHRPRIQRTRRVLETHPGRLEAGRCRVGQRHHQSIVPALDKLVAGLQQADTAVEQLSTGAGQAVTGADVVRRE